MKLYYANEILDGYNEDDDNNVFEIESITFEINGYVYEVGSVSDDGEMWFSRRRIEDYQQRIDTHENVERWIPELGSLGFEEYSKSRKMSNFKLLR